MEQIFKPLWNEYQVSKSQLNDHLVYKSME